MAVKDTDQVCTWIKGSEGGYVDNPHDPGGATNMGVTLHELAAWRGHAVSKADVRALEWPEAKQIMVKQYLDPISFNALPAGLDYCVADTSYNSGPVKAVKLLQKTVGVAADGHLGLLTLAAVARIKDLPGAVTAYDKARLGWLRFLPTWRIFGRGWSSRVEMVSGRALMLAHLATAATPDG